MTSRIFICGPSRSGTTMMARMLAASGQAVDLRELHFIEQRVTGEEFADPSPLGPDRTRTLARDLIATIRGGYFFAARTPVPQEDIDAVLAGAESLPAATIYDRATRLEAQAVGMGIPIDQTPRNVFYIDEILDRFPDARMVCMVRDPRDVVLSQKGKWKRRFLGGNIPLVEALRSWTNYHPLVITKIWRASAAAIAAKNNRPEVLTIRYEDVLADAEGTVVKAAAHCGLDYSDAMLEVERIGSSTSKDTGQRGIDAGNRDKWRRELSAAEIAICEQAAAPFLERFGYDESGARASLGSRLGYGLLLPTKLAMALPLNLNRIASLGSWLRKRIGG